jgi:predicted outer membrane repeat protein
MNLILQMHCPKFSWNDYFTATSVTTLNSSSYNSRKSYSATNVYVVNCLFNSFTSESSGGALYCTSTCLLVESSSFFSCKTSGGNGGAIYFYNTGSGECVLHGVCGYNCNAASSSHGQFSYIYVVNSASSKNYINYSSISRCVNENSGAYKTLRNENGKICYQSINASMNRCYYRSVMYCYSYSDSNSFTCSLLYSTFADNYANEYTCIRFNSGSGSGKYEIKYCNIIRNTQGNLGSWGTIYSRGNLMIKDSCILENSANTIFCQSSSSYTITISNCTVDKTTNNGYLTIQNTVTKSFILGLNHMSTRNCYSEYDSAGTLIPIIQSPTPSKKPRLCYTGDKFFFHPHLRDVISLTRILIFNFIHPYPSNDL